MIPNKLNDVYRDLNLLGFDSVSIRLAGAGSKDGPVITESGNAIVDIINRSGFSPDCVNDITNLNGVFDTGLFMNYEFERIS